MELLRPNFNYRSTRSGHITVIMSYRATTPPDLDNLSYSAISDLPSDVEIEESYTPCISDTGSDVNSALESTSNPANLAVNRITLSEVGDGNVEESDVSTEVHRCNCDRCPVRPPALPWQMPENLTTSKSRKRMAKWEKRYEEMLALGLATRNRETKEFLSLASMAAKINYTRNPDSNHYYKKAQ